MTDGQIRVDSMWVFLCVDKDNIEGVAAVDIPGVGLTPLVGADLAMVKMLRPLAQKISDETGLPITLSHFSRRTDQETIKSHKNNIV